MGPYLREIGPGGSDADHGDGRSGVRGVGLQFPGRPLRAETHIRPVYPGHTDGVCGHGAVSKLRVSARLSSCHWSFTTGTYYLFLIVKIPIRQGGCIVEGVALSQWC